MIRLQIAVALVVIAFASTVAAYTLIYTSATSSPLRWPGTSQPIEMRLNDQIGPGLPNLAAGSDPLAAIQRALTKYPLISSVQFQSGTTAVTSGGQDGVNIVSFADTPANQQVFEMAGGNAVIGLTLYFYSANDIIEADLLFNPALQFTTTLDSDTALYDAGLFDVEAVATHELGHVIGLHHTGVESATMWSLSSVLQRQLDADDIAGARTLYPPGDARGTIRGHVTVDSQSAFGAQIVAIDSNGSVAASALSLPDGSYAIEQLPAGSYRAYVEPLDGPHSAVPNVPCIRLGNLSGAGIYSHATLTTNFPTQFADGVVVASGQDTPLDFTLISAAQSLNPVQIGPATVQGGSASASVSGIALGVAPGSTQWIAVAGPGVDQVAVSGFDFGPGISADPTMHYPVTFNCNNSPLPAMLLLITVDQATPPGGRTITLTNGNQLAAFTGALRIAGNAPVEPTATPTSTRTPTVTRTPTSTTPVATATPGACVGDCDGNGKVSVDELVKGVNIALGNDVVADCEPFDSNHDGKVTVDELVQAVNAALNGCAT
ncbi:MAG TPA: matrixin family metalloprotease [Candidatus Kryptonia bacterium]|nr:matrixin family metalloprotease [Candidatus Kryptonia bacterium]